MPVGGRRRTGVAIELMLRLQGSRQHRPLPDHFTVAPIQTKQYPFLILFKTGGDKDSVAPNDGRRMALAGDRNSPEDVFHFTPANGDACLCAGAVAART